MTGTPWSDGVPGLTQRQIKSGADFVYKFRADAPGSHFYHAHERGQIEEGMYGAMIIHPKKGTPKPWGLISKNAEDVRAMERAERNVRPLIISDWRHQTSVDSWNTAIASGIEQTCYDSILINGKGRIECWSEEKRASLLNEEQKMFLPLANATNVTPKG